MAMYIQACGCKVGVETSPSGRYEWGRIVHCPHHTAADVMYEALIWALAYLEQGVDYHDSDYCITVERAKAALALADGEKDGG